MSKSINPLGGGGKGKKKFLVIAVLLFVGYLLFSDPVGSADAVNKTSAGVESGADSLRTFLGHIELGGGQ